MVQWNIKLGLVPVDNDPCLIHHFSCTSSDITEDSIIEFGIHWMQTTSRAVYDEKDSEAVVSEISNLTDRQTLFNCIYTFLNK